MKLDCAVITDQEGAFTVVIVPKPVLSDPVAAKQTAQFLQRRHFHMPTVLMARDNSSVPNTYYGRADLAIRVLRALLAAVPWQQVALRG